VKPKVAFLDFTCCEGCQLTVLNCEPEIPDLIAALDIVNFREAKTERSDDYDIAFVEGSCTRESEIPRLKRIREQAKIVVALGACSCIGGINSIKNRFPMDEAMRYVYGDKAKDYDTIPTRPIDAVIPVDIYIPGCPIDRSEFLSVTKDLLMGRTPKQVRQITTPVCAECKLAGNVCVFFKGDSCVGPITRGGCKAVCVTGGSRCWGCRGLVPDPNVNSEKEVLQKYSVSPEGLMRKFSLYWTYQEVGK